MPSEALWLRGRSRHIARKPARAPRQVRAPPPHFAHRRDGRRNCCWDWHRAKGQPVLRLPACRRTHPRGCHHQYMPRQILPRWLIDWGCRHAGRHQVKLYSSTRSTGGVGDTSLRLQPLPTKAPTENKSTRHLLLRRLCGFRADYSGRTGMTPGAFPLPKKKKKITARRGYQLVPECLSGGVRLYLGGSWWKSALLLPAPPTHVSAWVYK